jgi:guanidinopropionase
LAQPRPTEGRIEADQNPRYWDIATLLRVPREDDLANVDIGLFGIPIDCTGFRVGTREGPAAIREASRNIRRFNPTTGICPFDLARIYDLGDAPVNPFTLEGSVDLATEYVTNVRKNGVRPLAVGGDHTIALPMLRGTYDGEPLGMIQFDSHADVYSDHYGVKIMNGTFIVRAHEEGIIDPERIIQIGMHGTLNEKWDWQHGLDIGTTVVTMDRFEELGRAALIDLVKEVVGSGPVYLTFDVDGLDPVVAPGTSAREPGGLFMRDVQMILRGLDGVNIVGADVNEVNPLLDPSGITANAAANVVFEIACLMAADIAGV